MLHFLLFFLSLGLPFEFPHDVPPDLREAAVQKSSSEANSTNPQTPTVLLGQRPDLTLHKNIS